MIRASAGLVTAPALSGAPGGCATGGGDAGEANVFDQRPTVRLNGVKTVDVDDAKLASGPSGLQRGRGTIAAQPADPAALTAGRRPGPPRC
jgi:hypothetical protein